MRSGNQMNDYAMNRDERDQERIERSARYFGRLLASRMGRPALYSAADQTRHVLEVMPLWLRTDTYSSSARAWWERRCLRAWEVKS